MKIDALSLQQFRNYQAQEFSFDGRCNVIYGENAQGKTNLLEAIACLSTGRSPRARSDQEMIRFEADSALLRASVSAREPEFYAGNPAAAGAAEKNDGQRRACSAGRQSSGVLFTVYFCPEDLYLIRDGAAAAGNLWTRPCASSGPNMPKPWHDTTKPMKAKPASCATARSGPDLLAALPEFNHQMALAGRR